MTDTPPSYTSPTLEIFEWPQPICELKDPKTGNIVAITEPSDAMAVMASLVQFISITNQEKANVMISLEEAQELQLIGAVAGTVTKLEEIVDTFDDALRQADATETISATLKVIQEVYHLVPKVEGLATPEHAIEGELAKLWDAVSV